MVKSDDSPTYNSLANSTEETRTVSDNFLINNAIKLLTARIKDCKEGVANPSDAVKLAKLHLSRKGKEEFWVMWLNNQHQLIEFEQMFKGTVDSCRVYPREFLERAFEVEACACILVHNHPSGKCEPSGVDEDITNKLKELTALVDIRLLDHIIVAKSSSYKFSDNGLI